MKVEFHPLAKQELDTAFKHYLKLGQNLRDDFSLSVEAGLNSIRQLPRAHPIVIEPVRRILLSRFPYQLVYLPRGSEAVRIFAVAHLARRPGYWRRRLTP